MIEAVAVDAQGNVYIADASNYVVEKVSPAGMLSIFAGKAGQIGQAPSAGSATDTELSPWGLAIDGAGDVFISDDYETDTTTAAYVLKVDRLGDLSIYAGTGLIGPFDPGPALDSQLDFPAGLAVDDSGDLFVADLYNNAVAEINSTGHLSVVAGENSTTAGAPVPGPATSSPLNNPSGVAVGAGGELYIADTVSNDVLAVSPSGNLSIFAGRGSAGPPTPGGASSSELDNPAGVAVDGYGNVYIADTSNADIEEVFSGNGPTGTGTTGTTPTGTGGVPQSVSAPTLSGAAHSGGLLTCAPGSWTNSPTSFAYSWTADGTLIAGATSSTYKVTSSDEQLTIRCVVEAVNGAGHSPATTSGGLVIPVPKVPGCPAATGRLSGGALGPLRLGMSRTQARSAFRHSSNRGKKYEDFFCLTPIGVRAGYGSPALLRTLPAGQRSRFADRVVWASTSSGFYAVDGIRPGATLAAASAALHTGPPFPIGANDWYLASTQGATAVLKVRHGIVEEIGIADRALTSTRAAERALLTSFS
jgi:hypothetical protein